MVSYLMKWVKTFSSTFTSFLRISIWHIRYPDNIYYVIKSSAAAYFLTYHAYHCSDNTWNFLASTNFLLRMAQWKNVPDCYLQKSYSYKKNIKVIKKLDCAYLTLCRVEKKTLYSYALLSTSNLKSQGCGSRKKTESGSDLREKPDPDPT